MSIVVAVQKNQQIVVASDSQNNFGSLTVTPDNHSAQKIRRIGDTYLASTGWGIYDNILEEVLNKHRNEIKLENRSDIFNFFQNLWRDMHENYSFVNDQCQEDESPFGDLDANFMIINKNGIFNIGSDTSVTQFRKYYAIGSGCDFSLGAMHALYETNMDAETIARKAVETASAFNVYCGGEVTIMKL